MANAANTNFGKALDLLLARNDREGLAKASTRRVKSVIRAHLRPVFGNRKLSEFPDDRMRFVQKWLDERAELHGAAPQTLEHIRSAMKMAFDEAIAANYMAPPNPVTEFRVKASRRNENFDGEAVFTLEDISAMVRATLRRALGERELTYRTRFMTVLIGLLTAFRNSECSGLSWDCIDFDGRMVHVRRSVRDGVLVKTTKTGRSGFRSVPMSPILHAALLEHRDRLRALGHKVDGEAPVLVTEGAALVRPTAITGDHWPTISAKSGFVDEHGGNKYTYYDLRHTAANLWRTVGIQPDRLMKLMGHMTYETTVKNYLHDTPHFEVLRREVEQLIYERRIERTPEGMIDGLGFALFRRWREEGIEDIGCAPPRPATPRIGYAAAPLALSGPIIDVIANSASTIEVPTAPVIKTALELLKWQRAQAKELFLSGWTKPKIAAEFGISTVTLNAWLRLTDVENVRIGRLPREERQALMQRVQQLRHEKPDASSQEIAKIIGVEPKRVAMWERRRGAAMPRRPGAHKIGKYATDIRQLVDAGKTHREIAAELKRRYLKAKTPSHSGIGYFLNNIGAKSLRRGGGLRIETYDAQIRKLAAEGKSKEEICRELGEVSRSGILAYIKRIQLQTIPGNRGKRIQND